MWLSRFYQLFKDTFIETSIQLRETTVFTEPSLTNKPFFRDTGREQILKFDVVMLKEAMSYRCDPDCVTCCKAFAYIPVSAKEAAWLRRLGARVWEEGDEWCFDIQGGCMFLDGVNCRIYNHPNRPEVCKKIICYYMVRRLGLNEDQYIDK